MSNYRDLQSCPKFLDILSDDKPLKFKHKYVLVKFMEKIATNFSVLQIQLFKNVQFFGALHSLLK